MDTGWTLWEELLRGNGAKGSHDIEDGYAIRANPFTSAAGGTGPWKRGIRNLLDEIKFNISKDTSDIEVLYTGDGTCRTTKSTLFAGLEHLHITEFFS